MSSERVSLPTALYNLGKITLHAPMTDLFSASGRRGDQAARLFVPFVKEWTSTEECDTVIQHSISLLRQLVDEDASDWPQFPLLVFIAVTCITAFLRHNTNPSAGGLNTIRHHYGDGGGSVLRLALEDGLRTLHRASSWKISMSFSRILRQQIGELDAF